MFFGLSNVGICHRNIMDLTVHLALRAPLNYTTTLSIWKPNTNRQFFRWHLWNIAWLNSIIKPKLGWSGGPFSLLCRQSVFNWIPNTYTCPLCQLGLYVGMCFCVSMCLCVSICPSLTIEQKKILTNSQTKFILFKFYIVKSSGTYIFF